MEDSHFGKGSLGNILVEEPYALLSYQVLATPECQKGELCRLARCTTLAPMMWHFGNVHMAAGHVGTKSDTERKKKRMDNWIEMAFGENN